METIILKEIYHDGLDFRHNVKELSEKIEPLISDDTAVITIDVNAACLSRGAMDEFYKRFISTKSPLSRHINIVNEYDDFRLKLRAVIRSQGVKKQMRKFSDEQVKHFSNVDELKTFVRQLPPTFV